MSRHRRKSTPRRARRGAHRSTSDECVIVHPPTDDPDVWFGFCESLGLWRIKAPGFDAHGVIDPDGSIDGFYTALAAAADSVRPDRPNLAEHFDRLLASRDEPG